MSAFIIHGCRSRGLKVVSYACDGTDTERGVQTAIVDSAPTHKEFTLKHPLPGCSNIVIKIALLDGYPIVMIQDSNHGRKTFRNNLMSGARVLNLANDVVLYEDARKLAFDERQGPCFHRDFEKVDRQDDNAATRTFSVSAIEYLAQYHPDCVGLIIYLFIFGELIDAYQNRTISHDERIKMVLRSYYFIETWRAYLKATGYPEARYCISRQAIDIAERLVFGLISLVIAYRDYRVCDDSNTFPLLPWLHSTETCEHVFGECRKLVKDFTYLDFLYSVPKLHVVLRGIINLGLSSDAKARAAGYAHVYFSGDIDIAALCQFPSDDRIEVLNTAAFEEQDTLWNILGVSARDVLRHVAGAHSHNAGISLPSISSWWPEGEDPAHHHTQHSTSEDPFDFANEVSCDDDTERIDPNDIEEESELHAAISDGLAATGRKMHDDSRVEQLAYAAVMMTLDDTTQM